LELRARPFSGVRWYHNAYQGNDTHAYQGNDTRIAGQARHSPKAARSGRVVLVAADA